MIATASSAFLSSSNGDSCRWSDSGKISPTDETGEPQETQSLLYTAFKMSNDNDEAKLTHHWAISKSEAETLRRGKR